MAPIWNSAIEIKGHQKSSSNAGGFTIPHFEIVFLLTTNAKLKVDNGAKLFKKRMKIFEMAILESAQNDTLGFLVKRERTPKNRVEND